MKIITSGIKPSEKLYRCTCSHCHCRFEFQRFEGRISSDERDGDAMVIKCPECKTENWLIA